MRLNPAPFMKTSWLHSWMALFLALCGILLVSTPAPCPAAALIADHTAADDFEKIPQTWFATVRADQRIYYGHTSHGSQVVTGLDMLEAQNNATYAKPEIHEDDPDLGYPEWVDKTRDYLDSHPQTTLVIWSWCGQLSWYTSEEVDQYLTWMNDLEQDYPDIVFVYMTGHLDGSGPCGTLYTNNNHIRNYCRSNGKLLFDFAEIESYNPNGAYFADESDVCGWCQIWCQYHDCPDCGDCAHSHCFNCLRKGQAFWWMLARISGWDGQGGNTEAHDFYVQQSVGNNANSGDAWGAGHALLTIGRAMQLAAATSGADTIHVAAGNYKESVTCVSNITVYGGYPAAGGISRGGSSTIINGENKRRPVRMANCQKVIFDGFAIQNGSITGNGGGVAIESSSDIVLSGNTISNNASTYDGSGIYFYNSSGEISRNIIKSNTCVNWGGGICIYGSSGSVVNTLIVENTAGTGGGVSYYSQAQVSLINTTIAENTAQVAGGVGCYNGSLAVITNSICWDNSPDEIAKAADSQVTVTYSDISGGYAGTGNIGTDPKFEGNGSYELSQGSPCINTGTAASAPAVDLIGTSRPQGAGVDMGAYEFKFTPKPPSNLTAKATGSSQIVLGWKDNSGNETLFKIERKTGNCASTNPWAQIAAKGTNITTHTDSGRAANTVYSYRIRTYNSYGNSTYSNCVSAATGQSGAPASPINLMATSTSATKINLKWTNKSTSQTGVKIFRKAGTGAWTLIKTTGPTATSYSDTNAAGNSATTSYQYYVMACIGAVNSPSTQTVIVPFAPTSLTAVPGTTAGTIRLTWSDKSANEKGFAVYHKPGPCSSTTPWSLVATLGPNAKTYTNTGLTSASVYSYMVRAYYKSAPPIASGYSLGSNCASATAPN